MPQIRATMRQILPLLEAELRRLTGLPAECVNPWIGEKNGPHLQGDFDLLLRLRGFSPDQGWQMGAMKVALEIKERVEVSVRTRLQTDEPGTARQWLEDATLGHLQLRDLVLGLAGFIPTNAAGDALTNCEILLTPSQPPRPDAEGASPAWGEERLSFEVSYLLATADYPS